MIPIFGSETLLDGREILVLRERSIMVGVGSGELFRTQSASQFTLVESAIMVAVQLVKQCRCGLLRFRAVDRALVIRGKHSNPVRMAGLRQDRRYAGKQDPGGKCENYGAARYHRGHLSGSD